MISAPDAPAAPNLIDDYNLFAMGQTIAAPLAVGFYLERYLRAGNTATDASYPGDNSLLGDGVMWRYPTYLTDGTYEPPTQVWIRSTLYTFRNNLAKERPVVDGELAAFSNAGNMIGDVDSDGVPVAIEFEAGTLVPAGKAVNAGSATPIDWDPLTPDTVDRAPQTDIAGAPRVRNGRIDIGAYESK